MKRTSTFLLAAALLLSLFAGCTAASTGTAAAGEGTGGNSSTADSLFTLGDNEMTYGDTFGQGKVIDINIAIADEDWADILANPLAAEYHSATVTVNGTTVENVGVRTKGNSSLTSVAGSDSDRYGLRVKLDKYEKGQTLNGLDEFVLNASFADPSYLREYLTYAAMAYLGGPTPYVSYANLYINGELFGFYLMIEALDDSFVERHTSSTDAVMYKADTQRCTLSATDDASGFKVQVGKDENNTNVQSLIEVINSTGADDVSALEAILDVDSVLMAMAINTVMGNYDSYSGQMAHNYSLLYADGRFTYVGWDYNMSIGGFNSDNGASVSADVTQAVFGTTLENRPLIETLLSVEAYYAKYIAYVENLLSYFDGFEERLSAMAEVLRPYIENDPTAYYTLEKFENNITVTGTDLSEAQSGFGGMDMGGWDGAEGFPGGGEGFTLPDGMELPDGVGMPGGFGDLDGFTLPDGFAMPDGMELPDGMDRQGANSLMGGRGLDGEEGGEGFTMPQDGAPDGERGIPDGEDAMGGRGGWGGGMGNVMMNHEPCSIADYILQRCEAIRTQLGSTAL